MEFRDGSESPEEGSWMGTAAFSRQPDIHKRARGRTNKIWTALDLPHFPVSIPRPHCFQWRIKPPRFSFEKTIARSIARKARDDHSCRDLNTLSNASRQFRSRSSLSRSCSALNEAVSSCKRSSRTDRRSSLTELSSASSWMG